MEQLKLTAVLFCLAITLFSCSKKTTEAQDRCTTPTFGPVGGVYLTEQDVTISSTIGATILYTTDGSEPSSSSPEYTDPIPVSTSTTIKAQAYRAGWKDSQVATAVYTIGVPEGFVYIPAGTYTMGLTNGLGDTDELPAHQVCLSAYYIGKYEVTQAEWLSVMNNNPSNFTGDLSRPVERVSWYAILVYCNKRSIAEGKTPVYGINGTTNPNNWGSVPISNNANWNTVTCNWSANGYRLPTEAEWEFAARGAGSGPDYIYSGSDEIDAVAWYNANSGNITHPVGLKQTNSNGINDMSGNVWEWCWDWYGSNYYGVSPSGNPSGPVAGTYRVLRGGLWQSTAANCRVSYRNGYFPYSDYYNGGFRVCSN